MGIIFFFQSCPVSKSNGRPPVPSRISESLHVFGDPKQDPGYAEGESRNHAGVWGTPGRCCKHLRTHVWKQTLLGALRKTHAG